MIVSEISDQKFAPANPSTGGSDIAVDCSARGPQSSVLSHPTLHVALLSGGGDKPYALGMAEGLTSADVFVDLVGSNDHSAPGLLGIPRLNFLNLRGDQSTEANWLAKISRVSKYYIRLIRYAATAEPKVFHILWNNKFEFFDRTLLLIYYKLLGKKIVFTAHNVNAGKRDLNDSWLNRLSLRIHYRLCDHIFVHTDSMKRELTMDFGVPQRKVSVIPFGINNTVPNTNLSRGEARQHLGLTDGDRALLFFGNIAPYKGLEYLIAAFTKLSERDTSYRLIVAGRLKGDESYRHRIQRVLKNCGVRDRIVERMEYVPDEETELYFKAADVLILPYTRVFQSGVLFLGYSFGLPAIVADVGELRQDIIEGETGFVFEPRNSSDLMARIDRYFRSDLFHDAEKTRSRIKAYANKRYAWSKVAAITKEVYTNLLQSRPGALA